MINSNNTKVQFYFPSYVLDRNLVGECTCKNIYAFPYKTEKAIATIPPLLDTSNNLTSSLLSSIGLLLCTLCHRGDTVSDTLERTLICDATANPLYSEDGSFFYDSRAANGD